MSAESRFDALYKKDIQNIVVGKGEIRELRYVIPYGSLITIRLSTDNPVRVTMAGPHIEDVELVGTKMYKFTVDPGTELMIKFQGKTGLFAKPSNVTVEVEMYTVKDAVRIGEEINNLLDILKELGKDYYDLNKEHIQDVLRRVANVWKLLDNETRNKTKELMSMVKKFEEAAK